MRRRSPKTIHERSVLHDLIERRRLTPERQHSVCDSVYRHMICNSDRITNGNFTSIGSEDLGLLFHATDEAFFDGLVGKLCERVAARPLSFRLSTRMTSAGGMTTMLRSVKRPKAPREFEIAIATTPLFESFRDTDKPQVGGLPCEDRLQALQRIMEHEMVHLIEMLLWDDSNCSAAPFKRIVNQFFGHLESNHRLMTPSDVARKKLGISPGDRVCFANNGRTVQGYLHRVTKRATVLVPDAKGTPYTDGQRYQKYYVPLTRLRRA